MKIPEFIEKAIEGGWNREEGLEVWLSEGDNRLYCDNGNGVTATFGNQTLHSVLLDPLAWQAVGKVEMENGNGEWAGIGTGDLPQSHYSPGWRRNMHRLIDALADGKTIEQFLSTL